jgi:hypothetical protein
MLHLTVNCIWFDLACLTWLCIYFIIGIKQINVSVMLVVFLNLKQRGSVLCNK